MLSTAKGASINNEFHRKHKLVFFGFLISKLEVSDDTAENHEQILIKTKFVQIFYLLKQEENIDDTCVWTLERKVLFEVLPDYLYVKKTTEVYCVHGALFLETRRKTSTENSV